MSDIKIDRMVIGIYSTNCYFVYRDVKSEAVEKTKSESAANDACKLTDAIIFDAPDKGAQIAAFLQKNGFNVSAIFLTHGHFDHIWGAEELRRVTGAKIYALDKEKNLLGNPELNVSADMGRPVSLDADNYLKDGEEIEVSGIKIKVIATPGHTEGSCCYYIEEAGILIAGDTIFYESVGRTDFPTGNGAELEHSATEKLFVLPNETKVYPGHGDETGIGHEKKYNPFLV